MKATRKKRLEDAGMKVGPAEEFLDLTAAERAAVAEGITSLKSGHGKPVKAVFAKIRQKHGLRGNQPARPQKHAGGPTLPPPAGYSSWLAYATATMDTRRLLSDHTFDHQPQWPAKVTGKQMLAAAESELNAIESYWQEMERPRAGIVETTPALADWAEHALSKRETPEISSNPEGMKAVKRRKLGKTKFGKLSDI